MIKSLRMRWAGHITCIGEKSKAYRSLVGKPEGNTPLGRLRRRWKDNIKMNLKEIGLGGMEWIGLAEYMDLWRAIVNTVMNLWVP
jgi:hypothetical protein